MIEYIGGLVAGNHSINGTYTVDISGLGIQPGDVVVVNAAQPTTVNSTISGNQTGVYTYLWADITHATETRTHRSRAAYARMGATPDSTLTITKVSNTGFSCPVAVAVFRGVDATTPLDGVAQATASGINSNLANPPAITPVTPGAWVIGAYACATDTNSAATANAPGNMTGFVGGRYNTTTNTAYAGIAYYSGWASGAFDPGAWSLTYTWAEDSWTAGSFVLRPAPEIYTFPKTLMVVQN